MSRSMMIGVTAASGGAGGGISGVNTLKLNDGVIDQRAEVSDSASLDLTTGITASIYFLVRSFTGTMTVFSKYQDGIERSWFMNIDPITRRLQADIYVGGSLYSAICNTTMVVDTWYHGAFTYDADDLKVYLNAVLEDTNLAPTGNLDTSTADVRIGARGDLTNEQPFIGDIALPIIYSDDILQAGITELLEPKDPSLYTQIDIVLGLPLNAGSDTPEIDTSGNSNDATLIGAVLPDYTGVKLAIEQSDVIPPPVVTPESMLEFTSAVDSRLLAGNSSSAIAVDADSNWFFSFWFNSTTNNATNKRIFSLNELSGQVSGNLQIVHDNDSLHIYTGSAWSSVAVDVSDGDTHHILLGKNKDSIYCVVDDEVKYLTSNTRTDNTALLNGGVHTPMFGQYATGSFNYIGSISHFCFAVDTTMAEGQYLFNEGDAIEYADIKTSIKDKMKMFYSFHADDLTLTDLVGNYGTLTNDGSLTTGSAIVNATDAPINDLTPGMLLLDDADQIDLGTSTRDSITGLTAFSCALWVNTSKADSSGILASWNSNGFGILDLGDTAFRFYINANFHNMDFTAYRGKTIYLGYTYDNVDIIAYINGVEVGRTAKTGTINSSGVNLYLNRYGSGNDGDTQQSAEVRLWSKALSPAEFVEAYNEGESLPYADMSAGLLTGLTSSYELTSNDTSLTDVHGSGDTGTYIVGNAGSTYDFKGMRPKRTFE